jgi:glycosyltransferase involved in cell wall biosynthesis
MNDCKDNGKMPTREMSLIYIIGTYPGLTITFIDREIKTLRKWGVDLQIVAMRRPGADVPLSSDQRELQQGVTYLLPVAWLSLILSQLHFALRRPRCYFQTVVYLLTRPHPDLRSRIKTLLHFGEGVYAAYIVRNQQFREFHAHFVDRAATVALVAGRLLDKPYSLSIHAGADIFVNPILIGEKILEARHVVTCTQYNRTHVEAILAQDLSDKMSHVLHGLELAKYHPARSRVNGDPLILSVGQLAERKGFAQLIRACRSLKDEGYDFECHIVGRGPQHQELQSLIHQLALEDTVSLCGALPHEQVIEKYRQATIFALPCIETKDGDVDGIPNVLAEAMAMQVPVVSTRVSAIPELVVDRMNGLLVPSEDHAALVAALGRLLGEPALREELGKSGRQSVLDRFDIECNARRFATTLWPEWFN